MPFSKPCRLNFRYHVYVRTHTLILYAVTAVFYVIKEVLLWAKLSYLNIPRNLLVIATAISWWVGIISVNSDMSFTITNVVSHGIPYMALIWLYHHKQPEADPQKQNSSSWLQKFAAIIIRYAPAFFVFLVILAYLEEGLWDGFVWREHLNVFAPFAHLPAISDPVLLAFLVPFLALPQSTHYILDGFIWRIKDGQSVWSARR